MKKLFTALVLILIWSINISAQVSGNVKLLGESDHSGVKVRFNALSLTAKTDSTLSNAQGDYSKSLSAGTYTVSFSKQGYHDTTYTKHIIVDGALALNPTFLLSHDFIFVSEKTGGRWTKDKKYVLKGYIHIDEDSLTIEAGTQIYIYNHNQLDDNIYGGATLNGIVRFEGTPQDSITIDNFFPNKPGYCTLTGKSVKMNYVNSDVYLLIDTEYGNAKSDKVNIITNSMFKGLWYYISNNAGIIKYNKSTHYAIFTTKELVNNTTEVSCNHFKYKVNDSWINPAGVQVFTLYRTPKYGQTYYIKTWNIENNIFDFSEATDGLSHYNEGAGETKFNLQNRIYDGDPESKLVLKNNYFINYPAEIILYGNQLSVENNTFVNSQTQKIRVIWESPKIKNNILGDIDFIRDVNAPAIQYLQNNQIGYNSTFTNLPGVGIAVSLNAQGALFDKYLNVLSDPDFATAPLLKPTSPMIGAGSQGGDIGFAPKGTCLQSYFYGQEQDTLSISGRVVANGVNPIEATVIALEKNSLKEYSTTTNAQGSFTLKSLPKGQYVIKAIINSSFYTTTYYPNKTSIDHAETVALTASIPHIEIYMVPIITDITDQVIHTLAYPNPFDNELFIQNDEMSEVSITDVSGRPVYSNASPIQKINTNTWEQGVYIVKIGKSVTRFVKQ